MPRFTRRQFLEDSLLSAAAISLAPAGKALAGDEAKQSASPNEKLGVAVVGVHGQGNNHLRNYAARQDVEIRYIVDADEEVGRTRAAEVAELQGRKPKYVADLRRVLDSKSVDLVSIATPNHWHALAAIWAMQAGKDVYVEKPASHLMNEGKSMVATARKYGRICQVGTQSRSSEGMKQIIDYIHSGQLGDVHLARAFCYKRRKSIGPKGNYPIPKTVHYDLWSGPAPILPLTREKLHYDWHWEWPYGNGDLGNQGVHQMDIARRALGMTTACNRVTSYGGRWGYEDAGETPNTLVSLLEFDEAGKTLVFEVRGLEIAGHRHNNTDVTVYGTQGYAVIQGNTGGVVFNPQGNQVKQFGKGNEPSLSLHFANFIQAVRSRNVEDLNMDVAEGHLSAALVHAANIAYRTGATVPYREMSTKLKGLETHENTRETLARLTAHLKHNQVDLDSIPLCFGKDLAFDPATLSFPGNDRANQLLTREYPPAFTVPTEDKV